MTSDHTTEVLVGGAVLAVAAGFLIFAGQVTGMGGKRAEYELTASFRSADGVTVGTDVRMAGVKVGRVTDIGLDPETYRAATAFTVRDGIDVPDDSAVAVSSEGCSAAITSRSCRAARRSISSRATRSSSRKVPSALSAC